MLIYQILLLAVKFVSFYLASVEIGSSSNAHPFDE